MQASSLVNLRRHSLMMIKLSRTVSHAMAYKQLTKRRQVHAMFCCRHFQCVRIKSHCRHEPTEFLTTRTDQSKRDILIQYVLNNVCRKIAATVIKASNFQRMHFMQQKCQQNSTFFCQSPRIYTRFINKENITSFHSNSHH